MTRRVLRWLIRLTCSFLFAVGLFYACTVYYVVDHMGGSATFPADCGIVFGTAVWPVFDKEGDIVNSTAGPGIRRRVSAAAELIKKGSLHRLFLTGGKGEGIQKSEGTVMREYALKLGIPAEKITIEDEARSTWENLENTRPLTSDCSSFVAISDSYHLARIALQAHAQGWEVQTYPAAPVPSRAFTVQSVLREAVGIDYLVFTSLSR